MTRRSRSETNASTDSEDDGSHSEGSISPPTSTVADDVPPEASTYSTVILARAPASGDAGASSGGGASCRTSCGASCVSARGEARFDQANVSEPSTLEPR